MRTKLHSGKSPSLTPYSPSLALYSLDLALGHAAHDINKFALSFTHLLFQSMSQNDNEFPSPDLQKVLVSIFVLALGRLIHTHSHLRLPHTHSFSPSVAPHLPAHPNSPHVHPSLFTGA
ncbi:hypothetical protein K503DRAFT_806953 [Rhizopogon vinicolor AM-OR11-026]|uniref:Uncharacterized protein n=1 Tax=Rhizopogon vinicolor AM-OR11-026 TaxID=1314800 RepID=A0A1B7MDH6_9AGAM|nr:hypothetical protein K503DRAFT_806953 [Rhizopogon vinicolor AM-OR11-026]